MTPWVHAVAPAAELREAYAKLLARDISSLAVVDGRGDLVGIITRTDLIQSAGPHGLSTLAQAGRAEVRAVMTTPVLVGEPSMRVDEAARLLVEAAVHRLIVTTEDTGDPCGVFSTRDALRAVRERRVRTPVERLATSPVFTVGAYEPVHRAIELLERARISGLVVTDGAFPVGIFTQREALKSAAQGPDAPVELVMNPAIACVPPRLPIFRAAGHAIAMRVRRVVCVADGEILGVVTGIDFARALAPA